MVLYLRPNSSLPLNKSSLSQMLVCKPIEMMNIIALKVEVILDKYMQLYSQFAKM